LNNIIKLLFLSLITSHSLFGALTATVDSKTVELGETVTYSLNTSGEKIKRPNIQRLCNSDVLSTSSQTSIQIINGNTSKSYTLSYKFLPQKSCKIERVEVEVDGKIEASSEIEIEVKPVSGAKDLDFELTLSSNKKELYVGEIFDVTLTFKQKNNVSAVDSEFTPPELKGLWVKKESEPKRHQDDKYTVTKVVYRVSPQREGELKITKAQMKVASRNSRENSWGAWIPTLKWKTYFSNELNLDVKPLPSGVDLVGSFTINATLQKREIKANEALNVIVEVQGEGNLEDIKSFKQNVEGAAVFDEKRVINGTKLTQKIAFVAERDFVVPAFSLSYFDTKTKEIKTISTKEIPIKVKNSKVTEELVVKKNSIDESVEIKTKSSNEYDKLNYILIFVFGLIIGVLAMFFKEKIKFKNRKKSDFINNQKTLLMKLLPYKDDLEVKEIIESLEDKIYSNQEINLDKIILKKIKNRYRID
jgi:hypothetical protein